MNPRVLKLWKMQASSLKLSAAMVRSLAEQSHGEGGGGGGGAFNRSHQSMPTRLANPM